MLKTAAQITDEILAKVGMPIRFVGHNVPQVTPEALAKAQELLRKQIAAMDKAPGRFSTDAAHLGNQARATLSDSAASAPIQH
jgi:hypothetical protein